jgi:Peptidase family S41
MLNRAAALIFAIYLTAAVVAQTPAPSPAPAKSNSPSALKSSTPAPTPSPSSEQLIDSLGEADLQAAIGLLKSNFTNPAAITDVELNRAMLAGLLVRVPGGLTILPSRENGPVEPTVSFYGELFENHIGYARLGSLNAQNLKELDRKLGEFAGKKIDALIIELRVSGNGDFPTAAEFAKRFCPKGKTMFALRKQAARQDHTFTSDREPLFHGLMTVLSDGDTAGAAEAVGATLRFYNKALVIGATSAGRAVEYSDSPLPSGKIFRVATSEAVLPDGQSLFPGGLKPDLPVELAARDKNQIFRASGDKGMAQFVYETERPHLNEAALIAGTNPEIETDIQPRGRSREKVLHDAVLQRALDVVTSLEIYQKH